MAGAVAEKEGIAAPGNGIRVIANGDEAPLDLEGSLIASLNDSCSSEETSSIQDAESPGVAGSQPFVHYLMRSTNHSLQHIVATYNRSKNLSHVETIRAICLVSLVILVLYSSSGGSKASVQSRFVG